MLNLCFCRATRAVTLNFGMQMPAWYDLFGLTEDVREDEAGITLATKYAHDLIDKEVAAGVPANRIMLGGFSMGKVWTMREDGPVSVSLGGISSQRAFASGPAQRISAGLIGLIPFALGGALAIYAALTYKEPLAGVVGLSSFLLQRAKLPGVSTCCSLVQPLNGKFRSTKRT